MKTETQEMIQGMLMNVSLIDKFTSVSFFLRKRTYYFILQHPDLIPSTSEHKVSADTYYKSPIGTIFSASFVQQQKWKLYPFITMKTQQIARECVSKIEEGSLDWNAHTGSLRFRGDKALPFVPVAIETATAEKDAEIARLKLDLGNLHGRIGLFAEKWFGMSDNLSTDETFAKMDEGLTDKVAEITRLTEQRDRYQKSWQDGARLWMKSQHAELIAEREALRTTLEAELQACAGDAATIADLRAEVERLKAQLKRSQKCEAVCHCGEYLSKHNYDHSPVAMEEMCPHAEEANALTAENANLRGAIQHSIDYASGRESEWGERAEASFAILYAAIGIKEPKP